MANWAEHLERWEQAGVIDGATAERIRTFELNEDRPAGHRWQVVVALVLGGILLGAGVLLFVAAHWDDVSPATRLTIVVGLLAALHVGALAAADRFAALATVLHGVGTVAAGGAIAMVGQIFNMQEHWPGAVMLWALCAAVGYGLLRDQFQQICLLLLAPAWLICEWEFYAGRYPGSDIYLARMIAAVAAAYLVSFVHSQRKIVFGVLYAAAAIALVAATALLTDGWAYRSAASLHPLPWSLRLLAIALLLAAIAGAAWRLRAAAIPVGAVIVMTYLMPWLRAMIVEVPKGYGRQYSHSEPSVLLYVVVAATTVVLAWWGVQQRSRAVVNYAVVAFALTVMWFYFSSLLDKMNRSLGLIGLGMLFLFGGWLLERVRRRLMTQMQAPAGGAA